jgi:hypothetical protein
LDRTPPQVLDVFKIENAPQLEAFQAAAIDAKVEYHDDRR